MEATRLYIITVFILLTYSCTSPSKPSDQTPAGSQAVVDSSSQAAIETTSTKKDTSNPAFINIPSPIGWVSDFEKLFTQNQKEALESIIDSFEKRTSIEIAIITLDTSKVTAEKFDQYALYLSRSWGVGKKKENNGVTITLSAGHGRIRINNGYGIKKIISNAETQAIIDKEIIPHYKKGNYFQGTLKGLQAIINKLDTSF